MVGDPPKSTLKRPPAKLINSFNLRMIGDDRVSTYLQKGWSLAICCKDCPRLVEWTPPMLQDKFGERPKLRIADIASRLTCSGEEGCGSHAIAVFPHPYDGDWNPPAGLAQS